MRLSYSIPGKIWWIHDFLDREVYKGIHNAIIRERDNLKLTDVKSAWSSFLYNNMQPPKRVEVIYNYPPFEILKDNLRTNPYCLLPDLKHMTTTIHYLEKGTGINWHDLMAAGRMVQLITLNHKWHKQWGGEFMFTDANGHGFLPVVGNRKSLVIVKAPIPHKVNPVLSPLMPRISVQLFMK